MRIHMKTNMSLDSEKVSKKTKAVPNGEGAYLTKRFRLVHQQKELVVAMLLRSIRTNRSS